MKNLGMIGKKNLIELKDDECLRENYVSFTCKRNMNKTLHPKARTLGRSNR